MQQISLLLKLLEGEIKTSLGNDISGIKFMYNNYLSEGDSPEVLGETLNILVANDDGLARIGRVCLTYFPKTIRRNKIELHQDFGLEVERVKLVSERFLEDLGIQYTVEVEHA
ncbi:MAG: hypothetical protein WCI72_01545 [archaeon]